MDALLSIPPYPDDETVPAKPAKDFFVNNRTDLLVGKAEIDRMDYRKMTNRSIFLAERKYWLGLDSSTIRACLWILGGFTVLCLLLTTLFLQIRSHRVR